MMVSNGQLLANVSNKETDRDTCANLAYFCSYLKYLKYRLPERIIKIQPYSNFGNVVLTKET